MTNKLTLTQFESNLIRWTKHWYEGSSHENFWPQIGAIYKEKSAMDADYYEGIYHMVRDLWLKIANALPEYNRELLFGKYENDTLPTRSIFFWGSKYFGDFNPQLSFNNEDLIRARVTVMCGHITGISVKYYELLPLQEFAGLTLKKVDKD